MKPVDLITYCGLYCGTCARWYENSAFRELAAALAELVDEHGFHHWMPDIVKEFDYTEFRKALDVFSKKDAWLICRKGCKGGDGIPDCEVRKCCKDRRVDICFDCIEFPCERVKGNVTMIERAKEYRRSGKESWLLQQIEKANGGYEHHTDKYYQIHVCKYPPKCVESR